MMRKKQAGFTLMETMVSLVVLLGVSAIVMSGMVQMMWTQGTISNRTEMHTSVRSATELLQQEIGQAGGASPPVDFTGPGAAGMALKTAGLCGSPPTDAVPRARPRDPARSVFQACIPRGS